MNRNTLLFLNNLIYGIYNVRDFDHMKRQFLESLRTLIMFECGSIIMAGGPEGNGLSDDALTIPERYREVEKKYNLMEDYDYSRWHLQSALSITPNTLKKHLQHIYAKTGIRNRSRLVSLLFPEKEL